MLAQGSPPCRKDDRSRSGRPRALRHGARRSTPRPGGCAPEQGTTSQPEHVGPDVCIGSGTQHRQKPEPRGDRCEVLPAPASPPLSSPGHAKAAQGTDRGEHRGRRAEGIMSSSPHQCGERIARSTRRDKQRTGHARAQRPGKGSDEEHARDRIGGQMDEIGVERERSHGAPKLAAQNATRVSAALGEPDRIRVVGPGVKEEEKQRCSHNHAEGRRPPFRGWRDLGFGPRRGGFALPGLEQVASPREVRPLRGDRHSAFRCGKPRLDPLGDENENPLFSRSSIRSDAHNLHGATACRVGYRVRESECR